MNSKILHQRLRRTKGNAKAHSCVSCGKPAFEWAYQHTDPNPLFEEGGGVYSLDFSHYEPMCRSCHRKLDLEKSERLKKSWARSKCELTLEHRRQGGAASPHPGRPLTHEEAETLGRAGGTARAKQMKTDPVMRKKMVGVAKKNLPTEDRKCDECHVISTAAGMGNHQKHSGHKGWEIAP